MQLSQPTPTLNTTPPMSTHSLILITNWSPHSPSLSTNSTNLSSSPQTPIVSSYSHTSFPLPLSFKSSLHTSASPTLPPYPPPSNSHTMATRAKVGIFKPKHPFNGLTELFSPTNWTTIESPSFFETVKFPTCSLLWMKGSLPFNTTTHGYWFLLLLLTTLLALSGSIK